jgi:LAO/AO transport system kinase
MEVPDVLVVTKADLGDMALRAQRDLRAALRSLGSSETPVVSVSSLPPPHGIEGLVEALDAHRAGLDLGSVRLRSRRLAALADFTVEHGEQALRALGGRRGAERLLASEDASLSTAELAERLESLAREAGPTA